MGMCWGKQNTVYLPKAPFFSYQVAASVVLMLHKILTSWKGSPRSVLYAVVKVIFGNCLLNNSAICRTSFLSTIRKMSSVWLALEKKVVRCWVGWKVIFCITDLTGYCRKKMLLLIPLGIVCRVYRHPPVLHRLVAHNSARSRRPLLSR